MSIEELKSKARQEFVNNFINQANLSLILQILLKEAESQACDYVNRLSEEDLKNLVLSVRKVENESIKPSFRENVLNLFKSLRLKLGIKPKRKGFSTKKIS